MTFFSKNLKALAGYRQGDQEVLEALYRTYLGDVATLVRRGFTYDREKVVVVQGSRDPEGQCDLIQETFVRAFSETARNGFDGVSPFRPYLLRITKNLMIDGLRKCGRETFAGDLKTNGGVGEIEDLIDRNASFPPEDPTDQATQAHLATATTAFLATLVEPEQTFYELRYQNALAQEEVARRMGITRRKVRTLEARLRRGLKKHLQAEGLWE